MVAGTWVKAKVREHSLLLRHLPGALLGLLLGALLGFPLGLFYGFLPGAILDRGVMRGRLTTSVPERPCRPCAGR
jgi:hypothetical protein